MDTPRIADEEAEFLKALRNDHYDPICPDRSCGHPSSQHIDGRFTHCKGHVDPEWVFDDGWYRKRQRECPCNLTQEEVIYNREREARRKSEQDKTLKGPLIQNAF